jgi:cytoskeletal protein RodZ
LNEFLADIGRLLFYVFHGLIPLLVLVIRLFFDFRNAKKKLITDENKEKEKDKDKEKDKEKSTSEARRSKNAWLESQLGGSHNYNNV